MNKLVVLVGLMGSGKSTLAQELKDKGFIIHSSDALRQELFGDINDQTHNTEVFIELHRRIKEDLKKGKNVVFDGCNISRKRRMAFLSEIRSFSCRKIAILCATTYEQCLENNAKRDRSVPISAINRAYQHFNIPQTQEGFDEVEIHFFTNYDKRYELDEVFKRIDIMEQNNKHHTLTVGKHCRECSSQIRDVSLNPLLETAGLLHDIGKEKTQTHCDYKGRATEDCHYYNHSYVSAYDSIIINAYRQITGENVFTNEEILEIAFYIEKHMDLYFAKTEKAISKIKNLMGERMYNNICILHEADRNSK